MDRLLFCRGHDRDRLPDDTPDSRLDADADNIIDGAYSYIFFVFAGIPATYLYNTLAGIIRALGDSKTPVYFLILSSLLNIALDLLFIVQIGTGTAGAAYATVISQAVSGILCLIYMKKKFEILHMHHEETRISGRHIYILCKMGCANGTSILDHRDRLGCHPDCHQLLRFHRSCLRYRRSEDRHVLLLPV